MTFGTRLFSCKKKWRITATHCKLNVPAEILILFPWSCLVPCSAEPGLGVPSDTVVSRDLAQPGSNFLSLGGY